MEDAQITVEIHLSGCTPTREYKFDLHSLPARVRFVCPKDVAEELAPAALPKLLDSAMKEAWSKLVAVAEEQTEPKPGNALGIVEVNVIMQLDYDWSFARTVSFVQQGSSLSKAAKDVCLQHFLVLQQIFKYNKAEEG